MVAILALAVISYVCVIEYNMSLEEEVNSEVISVLDLNNIDIANISLTNSEGYFSFTKDQDIWTYDGDASFPLDVTYIDSILSSTTPLLAVRLLEDNLENISEYGLEVPSYKIVFTDIQGEETIVSIGDLNPVSGNYYAYTSLEDKVYMIDSTLVSCLSHGLYDMVMYDTLPSLSLTSIRNIEYSDTNTNINIDYFENGYEEYDYTESNYWFVKDTDGTYSVADTNEMSNLDSYVSALVFAGCHDYSVTDEELASYGLVSPMATLKIRYIESEEENDFLLYIGNVDASGNYYVKTNLSDMVYLMSSDIVDYFTGLDNIDLVNHMPFSVPISTMDSMTIKMTNNEWSIVFKNTEDEDGDVQTTYSVNGVELSSEEFGSFYDSLEAITAEMSNTESLSGTPYMTITYNRNTDYLKTVIINLYTYNASFYVANVNGENLLLINKTDIKKLVDNLKAF